MFYYKDDDSFKSVYKWTQYPITDLSRVSTMDIDTVEQGKQIPYRNKMASKLFRCNQ